MLRLRLAFLILLLLLFGSTATREAKSVRSVALPYRDAGLTEREAAAHLLNRFTFGPTPGQIAREIIARIEEACP